MPQSLALDTNADLSQVKRKRHTAVPSLMRHICLKMHTDGYEDTIYTL